MPSVEEHYATLLASIYVWMVGGIDGALERGAVEVASLGSPPAPGALAVDLGAGFGMHAIPLARTGYEVLAFDTSPGLLQQLGTLSSGLPITAVHADLLHFGAHLPRKPHVILCMGDTLTHLPDRAEVVHLFSEVAAALEPGGRFLLTFRDYTAPRTGTDRFISVRSDRDRILTCFLEEAGDHMLVHDILHQRQPEAPDPAWSMKVSSYRKLRLSAEWVLQELQRFGFVLQRDTTPSGMIKITGLAPA